jgi:hypothetical protein
LLPVVALAQGGVPDLSHCQAWLAYDGPEMVTLRVAPDGSGATFTEAKLPDGTLVDATVTLLVLDWNDDPVAYFPREDMWLESLDGGLYHCNGGTIADTDTDAEGMTQWVQPMRAGGFSLSLTAVLVNGDNVWAEGLRLNFNSPDINGDGQVSLHDVGQFASDFFGNYHFRSDLARDGLINLADVGWLAAGLGAVCP